MFIALLATVLVLGITTFQVIQGLFSALIMTVCTIVSTLAAFALYEPLCDAFLYARMPAYAHGVALLSLFLLILLALREAVDRFLPGNVMLGLWPDRIGGGACGLITGMVLTGVLAIGIQMLPFGPSAAGYRAYDPSLKRTTSLWLFYPDDFVLGMVKAFSKGGLGADKPFAAVHDNMIQELFCTRNRVTVMVTDEDKRTVPILAGELNGSDSDFDVKGVYYVDDTKTDELSELLKNRLQMILEKTPHDPVYPDAASLVVIRVRVGAGAQDEADGVWRLPATHFRFVDPAGKAHYPVGYLFTYNASTLSDSARYEERPKELLPSWNLVPALTAPPEGGINTGDRARVADLAVQRPREIGAVLNIDWVYRLPSDSLKPADIRNSYMVFRDRVRKPLPSSQAWDPKGLITDSLKHAHMKASDK